MHIAHIHIKQAYALLISFVVYVRAFDRGVARRRHASEVGDKLEEAYHDGADI